MVRHFLLKAEKYFNSCPKGRKEGKKNKFSYETEANIQKQFDKPFTWFFKYFPIRIKNVSFAGIVARKLVYNFKDGDELSVKMVAEETASQMKDKYGDKCSDIVFSCVPASSAVKNEIRYKKYCRRYVNSADVSTDMIMSRLWVNVFQFMKTVARRRKSVRST